MKIIKIIVHWLLALIILLYIITGYGITKSRIVEKITFGILYKHLAFRIHEHLIIPFLILIAAHFYLAKYNKK